jgi:hypothetical protein
VAVGAAPRARRRRHARQGRRAHAGRPASAAERQEGRAAAGNPAAAAEDREDDTIVLIGRGYTEEQIRASLDYFVRAGRR